MNLPTRTPGIAHPLRLGASIAIVLLATLAVAAPAQADMLRKTQATAITVSDAGQQPPVAGSPYPSTINVAGADGWVTGVTVRLNKVNHSHPDDMDVILAGPGGQAAVIMSDTGGLNDLVGTNITLDDAAADPLPDTGAITSGTYRPTNYAADALPPSAPYGPGSLGNAFDGTSPNGNWTLYASDDGSGSGGEISGGWTLTLTLGKRVGGTDVITMADDSGAAPASPYPSQFVVDGAQGRVKKATVRLLGFTHQDPGDVDIMLEAPNGKAVTLLSDAGGSTDVGGVDLRIADDETASLPEFGTVNSGSYKPTNHQGADAFPAPAPAQAADALGAFAGTDPNGVWRLWVVDDAGGATGKIGGWSLQLTLTSEVQLDPGSSIAKEGEGTHTLIVKRPEGGGPATVHYELPDPAHAKDVKAASGDLTFALGQKTKSLPITVLDDAGDEPIETARVLLSAKSGDVGTDDGEIPEHFAIEDDDATDVRGDFNGDGRADQAIGIPKEDLPSAADAGAVQVLYGTDTALSGANDQRFTQDVPGVPDVAEPGDRFGAATAASDFNGDGYGDLAIGTPGEDDGGVTDMGRVTILYGSATGLKTAGALLLGQGSPGVPDGNEPGDKFGGALAAGNLGRGTEGDLAIGAPGEDVGAINSAGAVTTLYGTADGLGTAGAALWHQDVAGVEQTAEAGDAFGSVLAIGDLGSGAEGDLIVGVPTENAGRGVVQVLYGTTVNGVSAAGDTLISQNTPGLGSSAQVGDKFGAALAVGSLQNAESAYDLAVGSPGEDAGGNADSGTVHVLFGRDAGALTTQAAWNINQGHPVIATGNGIGDRFGAALAIGDFGGKGDGGAKQGSPASLTAEAADLGDLAVGVPGESFGELDDVGAVSILYGDLGPDGPHVQHWHQDVAGVAGTNEAGDKFGAALAAAPYRGAPAVAGLSIGVPGDKAGGVTGSGAMATLYGTPGGLMTSGSQRWSQGASGLQDAAEAGDAFGSVLAP